MLVDIGDGVWVDPQYVIMVADERGPGEGRTTTGVYLNGDEKQSVDTPVAEVAKRVNEALIAGMK